MQKIAIIFLSLLLSNALSAQDKKGILFFEGTWQQALEEAQKTHKILFVDAFTTWCGPCQRMAKEVFSLEEVGIFYNKHFINVKLDMEKGEGPKFAQKYKITSYPTLLFIDEKGEEIQVFKGSRPADQFINLGKGILNRSDKSGDLAEKYEAGDRSPDLLRAYSYALLTQNKASLKIANEYLRSQKDLSTAQNQDFIFDFCIEADSRIFDMLLENRKAFIAAQGEAAYKKKAETACNATVRKAIEMASLDLLKIAKSQMKKAVPEYAAEYAYLADMQYHFAKQNYAALTKSTDQYLQKFAKKDAARLNKEATNFAQYVQDKAALLKAEKWAEKAVQLEPKREYMMTYMYLLQVNGKEKEAQEVEQKMNKLSNTTPPIPSRQ
jgi:thiol-disulfide isomerase/thioredoxin